MAELILAVALTSVYYIIGYKLSQIITINREPYSPIMICLWPLVFILFGITAIVFSIKDLIIKK